MEKVVRLKDDTEVLIRDLRDDDAEQSLAFFQALPPADRIYLRNRKLPLQVDISKVEFSASFLSLKTAGGSPPNASWGRSSL